MTICWPSWRRRGASRRWRATTRPNWCTEPARPSPAPLPPQIRSASMRLIGVACRICRLFSELPPAGKSACHAPDRWLYPPRPSDRVRAFGCLASTFGPTPIAARHGEASLMPGLLGFLGPFECPDNHRPVSGGGSLLSPLPGDSDEVCSVSIPLRPQARRPCAG
jgi:hypothetical protein